MDGKKKYLNELYGCIADELNISNTMREKAISSYKAVGKWLGECDPDLDVRIMPQGSINLGTVIRPLSDKDDFDIDLVCLLKNGSNMNASEIKGIVGKRLLENQKYKSMLEGEGKRCWTLQYEEFHMDILPAVPKYGFYLESCQTEIRITHKLGNGLYQDRYSNPAMYKKWFEERMSTILLESKRDYALRNQTEIEAVPTYFARTPLQKAIQLLKRHRDMVFANDKEGLAPISIIITTLAAHAYNNEDNLVDALEGILGHMADYIKRDNNQKFIIVNPVMIEENFAEKWNDEPRKARAFYTWLDQAMKDIVISPMKMINMVEQGKHIQKSFGEGIVNRALKRISEATVSARDEGKLYVNGLKSGLSYGTTCKTDPIPRHTFYGK